MYQGIELSNAKVAISKLSKDDIEDSKKEITK